MVASAARAPDATRLVSGHVWLSQCLRMLFLRMKVKMVYKYRIISIPGFVKELSMVQSRFSGL